MDVPIHVQMHYAITSNNLKLVEKLIEEGCDINYRYKSSGTYLTTAISCKRNDICRLLISKGVEINKDYNHYSMLPLFVAIQLKRHEIIDLLLEKVKIDKDNNKDYMEIIVYRRHKYCYRHDIARYLIDRLYDIDVEYFIKLDWFSKGNSDQETLQYMISKRDEMVINCKA